jgi:two-component sensor histidine kinase
MVRWSLGRAEARDVLTLKWEEQNGPAISPPSRQGFGMRLIERGLAHQLNGRAEIIFAPDGVRAEIEIPLSEAANESAATAPASVAVPVS